MRMLLVVGLIAAAILYFRCGERLGLGPGLGGFGGDGVGPGSDPDRERGAHDQAEKDAPGVRPAVAGGAGGVRRCKLRLDASGLTLDDRPSTMEDAVEACKGAGGAELTTTGDATFGEYERVTRALDQAGVEVFVRDPRR